MKQRSVFGVTKEISPQGPNEDSRGTTKKRGFKAVDELLSQQGPLEEEQQEAVLHEFEEMQLSAARTWRGVFGVGAALLAAYFLWAASQQYLHPWGQPITGKLQAGGANGDVMAAVLFFQALALAACALGLLQDRPPKGALARGCLPGRRQQWVLLLGSLVVGLLCCAYWLQVHYNMILQFGKRDGSRHDLLWVPLAPPAYTGLCCWVVSALCSTGSQVASLRQLKYEHHTA